MAFGNGIGFQFTRDIDETLLFNPIYGGFLMELDGNSKAVHELDVIGVTSLDENICLADG